ncbi:MAG: hypothetical protein IKU37_08725 [Candidatus Gastranaerophilales bacterium]|nr:hypothetical protein [Candidatus Gastranaerophilales bacterium]
MSKYILKISETNYIEVTEEKFNGLENINLITDDNKTYKGKKMYINIPNKELSIVILAPIDNFEVIYEPSL